MLVILATLDAEIWKIKVQGLLSQTVDRNSKYKMTRAKWTGGFAQVVECKPKVMSSNPSLNKKKNHPRKHHCLF
jgi:hypothetical protein